MMLDWIPDNVNYNLCYRRPTGYGITISYGIPGQSKFGSLRAKGATINDAVTQALGQAQCPECGRPLVFDPMAELAFCSACVGYLGRDHVQWSNLATITPPQEDTDANSAAGGMAKR